jgi:hypothetical protein
MDEDVALLLASVDPIEEELYGLTAQDGAADEEEDEG